LVPTYLLVLMRPSMCRLLAGVRSSSRSTLAPAATPGTARSRATRCGLLSLRVCARSRCASSCLRACRIPFGDFTGFMPGLPSADAHKVFVELLHRLSKLLDKKSSDSCSKCATIHNINYNFF
jgi:hypothetical protein